MMVIEVRLLQGDGHEQGKVEAELEFMHVVAHTPASPQELLVSLPKKPISNQATSPHN
jgi:hypothetical protein